MKKVVVFGSGNGSNFEAIVNYFKNKNKNIKFTCVSDRADAYILERARNFGIEYYNVPFSKTHEFLKSNKFDLIVLAGYMRILPKEILKYGTFINIHPSLLPKYKGKDAVKRAFNAGEEFSGVTVHYVNEEIDSGEIIDQATVNIEKNMTINEFEKSIHAAEHNLYPQVIYNILFSESLKGGLD